MSRFDYVAYDSVAQAQQAQAKAMFEDIEAKLDNMPDCRAKSLAITKLEESYMWVGKAIRDGQIERNKPA